MPRQARPDVPAHLETMIDGFEVALEAVGRTVRTRQIYGDAARWFAGELPHGVRWNDPDMHLHLRTFFARTMAGYSKGYRNQVGRSLQAFFKWYAIEEDVLSPFGAKFRVPDAPKIAENPVVLIAIEQLRALLQHAEAGRDFASRRDAAILRLFAATGCRLAEIARLQLDDVDVKAREARVVGKGGKVRTVRFDARAATALNRYLRVRAEHRNVDAPMLWLGLRAPKGVASTADAGISPRGVYRVVRRRGRDLGLDLHPHLFRHSFAARWLDEGGAEGDLMELMGWDSPEMLRHYGAAARQARARRAYDKIDVMGGV